MVAHAALKTASKDGIEIVPRRLGRWACASVFRSAGKIPGIEQRLAAKIAAGAEHLQLRTDGDWLMDLIRYVAARRERIWGRAGQVAT